MNAEGYRTTLGNPGLAEDDNGELYETGGPAIIPVEDFLVIRAMRPSNNPDHKRAEQREYLVTGPLGVCGRCGTVHAASPSNSGSRGHRCAPSTAQHPGGCGKVRINADLLERYVGEHVLAELAKPEVSALLEQARDQLLAEAAELRKTATVEVRRQKELGEDCARSPGMSLDAFKAADRELARQVNAYRA